MLVVRRVGHRAEYRRADRTALLHFAGTAARIDHSGAAVQAALGVAVLAGAAPEGAG